MREPCSRISLIWGILSSRGDERTEKKRRKGKEKKRKKTREDARSWTKEYVEKQTGTKGSEGKPYRGRCGEGFALLIGGAARPARVSAASVDDETSGKKKKTTKHASPAGDEYSRSN